MTTNTPAPRSELRPPPAAAATLYPSLPVTLQPDRALLTYFGLSSLLLGPFFFFMLVPLYFRFRTLRYEIDEEGISMRWGILFRREVSLNYARIQDIHLTSNVVERWLGLGRIQVQTASGSATAEMTIEGVREYEELRDFLYARTRGARDSAAGKGAAGSAGADAGSVAELTEILRSTAQEVRAIREFVEARAEGRR